MESKAGNNNKWYQDGLMFCPLKCVEVDYMMGSVVPTIRGTSEKECQGFGQYSGSGCIVQ